MSETAAAGSPPLAETDTLDRELWRIDHRTEMILRALAPSMGPVLDRTLEEFYAFMATQPRTAPLLGDPGRNARVRRANQSHWERFFRAEFDAAYIERVRAVGLSHQAAGLIPRDYVAGYSLILERLVAHVTRSRAFNRDRAAEEAAAIVRAALMEVELALSVYYRSASTTEMTNELEEFADSFERELSETVDLVRRNAATMEGAADEVLGAANKVATEGEYVTQESDQTNMNARLIALAARGLSDSFHQITAKVESATRSAQDASVHSQEAQRLATTLAEASERIGNVVKLIERIAKETRLLALNASIEAARAGDAGKGFAVVANEVKTLADQTNNATGDIRSQIEAMQASIQQTVGAINDVAGRVGAVSEDIESISNAVGEQSIVTRDIADNADEMAESMQSVHNRIESVAEAADRSTRKASLLWENATGLVRQIFGIKRRVTASLRGIRYGNRRRDERIAIDVPCTCVVDNLSFESRLDNISAGGCQVRELQLASADGYPIRLDIQGIGRCSGVIVSTERETAHVRFDPLPPDVASRLSDLMARRKQEDAPLVAIAEDAAAQVGALFERAVEQGDITVDQLFSTEYQEISGTDPVQCMTASTELCDRLLPAVQEPLLQKHPQIVFCAAVDRNGYLPTHNKVYSQPQRPGDPEWNAANSRNRRIFDDPTGLAAARNRQAYLVQTYRRTCRPPSMSTESTGAPSESVAKGDDGSLRLLYGCACMKWRGRMPDGNSSPGNRQERRVTELAIGVEGFAKLVIADLSDLKEGQGELKTAVAGLQDRVERLEGKVDDLQAGQAKLEAGQEELRGSVAKLEAGQAKLEAGQEELRGSVAKLEAGQAKLEAGQKAMQADVTELQVVQKQILVRLDKLEDGQKQIVEVMNENFRQMFILLNRPKD